MKIYLDFDGTLFNTDKFYQDYLVILNKYNISSFEIEKMKKELFTNRRFNLDILTDYIISKYNIKNLKQEVESLYNNSYVFEDVILFISTFIISSGNSIKKIPFFHFFSNSLTDIVLIESSTFSVF